MGSRFRRLLLLMTVPVAAMGSEGQTGVSTLEQSVEEALAANPEIEASEARWRMFADRVRQVGTLEDPMVMLSVQNALVRDPLAFDRDFMTAKVIGISQMLPFFGRRSLEREGAGQEAESARWIHEERKIELRRMVKETWYELYFVDRSLEVVDKNIDILDDLTRFSETMYGVGEGLQQDVLKAQVDRSKMEEMRIILQQRRQSLEALFNTLLYRPVHTAVAPAPELEPPVLTRFTPAELEQLAEENRPLVRSLAAQIEKTQVSRRLADNEAYPEFNVFVEYMQRDPAEGTPGHDMYSAGVTFNLPLQRERRRAMGAEAASENRMVHGELNMLRNQIRFGIADGLARLESTRKLAELYREGLLPQAVHALEAATSAYRVGKADFMNVLDSRMALFSYEREYHEAVAEHQMQLAVLEGVIGTPLPAGTRPDRVEDLE